MIHLVLGSLIILAAPETGTTDPAPAMEPEIARSRILQAIQSDTKPAHQVETLAEVIERCETPEVLAEAHFNLGVVQLGFANDDPLRLDDAIGEFLAADRISNEQSLQSQARFNLGHAFYLQANQPTEPASKEQPTDIQAMIETMKAKVVTLISAAGAFRSVMEVDDTNSEAASNVERVRIEVGQLQHQIDALEEMLKEQQEQQSQQQQQQQDAADALKELAEQQQDQAENTASNPPEDKQQQEQQQSDQQELSDQTKETKDEIAQQQQETDEIEEKIQEAQDAQKRAQEAMEQGDQELAAQEQAKAAEALKEAAEQMQEKADESKEQQGEEGEGEEDGEPKESDEGQEGEENENDEISEVAKNLLDKERREREARQAYRAKGRPVKVEKDW